MLRCLLEDEAEALKAVFPNREMPSMQAFVLKYGRRFERPKGSRHKRQPAKQCFANSQERMRLYGGLIYVEGYVLLDKIQLPILHGWCITKDANTVIDVTGEDTAERVEYFGVPFTRQFMRFYAKQAQLCSVLDNWMDHWPVLTMPEALLRTIIQPESRDAVLDVLPRRDYHERWEAHWSSLVV